MGDPVPGPNDIEHTHCGSPTTHFLSPGVPARILTCDPVSSAGAGGIGGPNLGLARIGDLVEGHPFGDDFHAPNPIVGPGSGLTSLSGGVPASIVGDVLQ